MERGTGLVAFEVNDSAGKFDGLAKLSPAHGVRVAGLCFAYPGGAEVLKDLSFEVSAASRVLLAGATGSGKSTLLRCLKPELTPQGTRSGEVLVDGLSVAEFDTQLSAGRIGFVMQDPHQQIVMDTVKAELAFGLENLGTPPQMIQRRIAEIANYFGIHAWADRSTSDLSGGEKQLLNLAAVIAMQPRTLLLDEPTVGLDPIASREFLELVQRVNEELGITIILVEHQQEDVLSRVNQVLYLHEGELVFDGGPREFALWLHDSEYPGKGALPVASRFYLSQTRAAAVAAADVPLDVREGRQWLGKMTCGDVPPDVALPATGVLVGQGVGSPVTLLSEAYTFQNLEASAKPRGFIRSANSHARAPDPEAAHASDKSVTGEPPPCPTSTPVAGNATSDGTSKRVILEVRNVWYRYSKEGAYILKDASLEVNRGAILGIVGANASGKSTVLSLLFGSLKPQHGKIKRAADARLALLPQDPTALFIRDSVQEELMEHARDFDYDEARVAAMLARMGLADKVGRHPFDLSGGEQQKLALAKLLLTGPGVLLLDEPTKGLDALALQELGELLRELTAKGKTVVLVSHDLEFVAATADECLMLFDGASVGRGPVEDFFTGNMFYTTALQRITQGTEL